MYAENIPRIDTLQKLATASGFRFPDDAKHLADTAKRLGYDQDIISFLRLFHPQHMFRSQQDFIDRCEELEIRILR